jgi:uncharacterized protein with gpF-like domain
MPVDPYSLPFDEAIAFFREKLNIATETWTDLWRYAHSKAFTVAGAMDEDLLADLRSAVDKAIADGITLQTFRKEFDQIVQEYGWQYKGGRDWRSRVIYDTNLRTAYMAGRWKGLVEGQFPYLQYHHAPWVKEPRPMHLHWDGLILRFDDPWWDTHYPPNGWGCQCWVSGVSRGDLRALGRSGPDPTPDDGTYEWIDKATGEIHNVPRGIDPGWDYNVGKAWMEG